MGRLDIFAASGWTADPVHFACFVFVVVRSSPAQVSHLDDLGRLRADKVSVEAGGAQRMVSPKNTATTSSLWEPTKDDGMFRLLEASVCE
jgi:hypothetical protein